VGKPGTGSYFPVKAVQSFNAKDGLIRNGVYLGPVASLFFDGAFVWREKQRMLEFQFDKISFTLVRYFPYGVSVRVPPRREGAERVGGLTVSVVDDDSNRGGAGFLCRVRWVRSSSTSGMRRRGRN
jgi:hypothetical protein